jgi:hypothetical protein
MEECIGQSGLGACDRAQGDAAQWRGMQECIREDS